MLQASHIQQLIDESVESIDVLHHRFVKLLPLRAVYGSSIECLKIQLERRNRGFQLVRYRIDEVALASVQIDVLNDPNKVENDPREHKGKHNGPNRQQNPVDVLSSWIGDLESAEDVQQDPAHRQSDEDDDHQDRQEDRPFQTLAFEHASPARVG